MTGSYIIHDVLFYGLKIRALDLVFKKKVMLSYINESKKFSIFTLQKNENKLILDNTNKARPEISYPCEWNYKIISKTAGEAVEAAELAADGFKYEITASNVSKHGKYISINLSVEVENEEERNLIFGKLESDEKVIMVL